MRIYWFDDVSSGCGHVRVSLPMQELVRRGHKCAVGYGQFSVDTLQWDAIVLGRLPMGDTKDLVPEFQRRGVKVIYDIDDALDLLEPENLNYSQIMPNISTYFNLLRSVDLVTVTTPELATHTRKFVSEDTSVQVLPNCIRADEWRTREACNPIPRIGFTGGHSRLVDLLELLKAIKGLEQEGLRKKFEFIIFGISSSHSSFEDFYQACVSTPLHAAQASLMETLEEIRGLLAGISHRWERAVPVQSYPRQLAALNLDLGLCPLRPSDFNRHKSCLKAYEYAMTGTEVLCAREKPYVDELPEKLFSMIDHDAEAWRDTIAGWIGRFSAGDNAAKARAQRNWVLEHRSIEKNGHRWETAFSRLLEKR